MTVNDLADTLKVNVADIIKKAMVLGVMININSPIDYDTAELICIDYNKTLKREETEDISNFEEFEINDKENQLQFDAYSSLLLYQISSTLNL